MFLLQSGVWFSTLLEHINCLHFVVYTRRLLYAQGDGGGGRSQQVNPLHCGGHSDCFFYPCRLVAVAAATGISGLLLGKLAEPVSAASSGEVAFYTGSSSQSGDLNLFWDNVNKRLGVDTSNPEGQMHVGGSATADVFCGLGPHPNTLVSGTYVGPAMNCGYSGNSMLLTMPHELALGCES